MLAIAARSFFRAGALALCLASVLADPGAACAADFPEHRIQRKAVSVDEGAVGCAREIPVEFHRPRLVGEPPCFAVRPYGLSRTLYNPPIPPEFGTTY